MKPTVTIEDDLSAQLARAAQASGADINKLVNDLIRAELKRSPAVRQVEPRPFVQRTYNLGWHSGMTWEKLQQLLNAEETEVLLLENSQV